MEYGWWPIRGKSDLMKHNFMPFSNFMLEEVR